MDLTAYDDYGNSYTLDVANQQIVRSDGVAILLNGADQTAEALNAFSAVAEDIPAQVAAAPPPPPPDSGCGKDPSCGGGGMQRIPVDLPPLAMGPTARGQATIAVLQTKFRVPPKHRLMLRWPPHQQTSAAQPGMKPGSAIEKTDVTDIESGPTTGFDCYDLAYAISQISPQWETARSNFTNYLNNLINTATTWPVDLKKLASQAAGFDNYATYIESLPEDHALRRNENVFSFSAHLASTLVFHALHIALRPVGISDIGEQVYHFPDGSIDAERGKKCDEGCYFASVVGRGDAEGLPLTGADPTAARIRRGA